MALGQLHPTVQLCIPLAVPPARTTAARLRQARRAGKISSPVHGDGANIGSYADIFRIKRSCRGWLMKSSIVW